MMIQVKTDEREKYLKTIDARVQIYSAKANETKAAGRPDLEQMARGAIDQLKFIESMIKGGREVFLNEDDLFLLGA